MCMLYISEKINMDSSQMEDIIADFPELNNHFGGVFARDELSKILKSSIEKPLYFIVNFDPSYKSGTHWICIKLDPTKQNYYFDSYGNPPFHPEMLRFLSSNYEYNKFQLQYPLTTSCGQWCIYFMFHDYCGFDEKKIFDKFVATEECLLHNDHRMNEFLETICERKFNVTNKKFLGRKQIAKMMRKVVKTIPPQFLRCKVV